MRPWLFIAMTVIYRLEFEFIGDMQQTLISSDAFATMGEALFFPINIILLIISIILFIPEAFGEGFDMCLFNGVGALTFYIVMMSIIFCIGPWIAQAALSIQMATWRPKPDKKCADLMKESHWVFLASNKNDYNEYSIKSGLRYRGGYRLTYEQAKKYAPADWRFPEDDEN